jgi:hypothetical protein
MFVMKSVEALRESNCHLRHAVVIEPILRRQSPENGNIRGASQRLPPDSVHNPAKSGAQRRDAEWQKPAIGGPFSKYWGHSLRHRTGWLATQC